MILKHGLTLFFGLMLVSHFSHAGPPSIDPKFVKPPANLPGKLKVTPPRLNLKPDLIVDSVGYSNEFCESGCSDTWTRELGVIRISAETCHFVVRVKNIGSITSKPGQVQVQYEALTGVIQLSGDMPQIRAGGIKNVVVSLNNSRPIYLYRKFQRPIRARVDSTNTNAESNEGNNTKEVYIR